MKSIITIPTELINAAHVLTAKDDVRYYLTGIHLNKKGSIEATNGHFLIRIFEPELMNMDESMIIQFDALPKHRGSNIEICLDESGPVGGYHHGWGHITHPGKNLDKRVILRRVLAEKYPDVDSLIEKSFQAKQQQSVSRWGLNPDYLHQISNSLHHLMGKRIGMKVSFYGEAEAAKVEPLAGEYEGRVVYAIMPMRID